MVTSPHKIWAGGREEGCRRLLNLATRLTGASHGAFLQWDGRQGSLSSLENQKLPPLYWQAAREVTRNRGPLLFQGNDGISAPPILAVPLHQERNLLGVLIIADRQPSLNHDDLNLVMLLAESPSLVADSEPPQRKNNIYLLNSVKALLQSLEARDNYTCRHCFRVTELALHFGRALGLPKEDLQAIKTAGLLHDLGKVGISDSILLKRGSLTQEECIIIKTHPVIGAKIVKPLGLKQKEMEIILHHHERWDGRGYPWGLAGAEIPFLCRLVALVDSFDALTSDRPYRSLLATNLALEEIATHAGTQFDPHLTEKFIDLLAPQAH